jgi:aminodeoxyfutalosine deaminase
MKNQQIKPENSPSDTPGATLVRAGAWYSSQTPAGPRRHALRDAGIYFPLVGPVQTGPFHDVLRLAKELGPFQLVEKPGLLALPGLVNAHAHLDLFLIGPKNYTGTFTDWLAMVSRVRREHTHTPAQSVQAGLEAMRQAGICAVGDISGTVQAAQTFLESGTPGVAYLEALGFPPWRALLASQNLREKTRALRRLNSDHASIGIEPHAPNTTNALLYQRQYQPRNVRRCTHIAETLDEARFFLDGTGPCRDLLQKFNRLDPSFVPPGISPVQWLGHQIPSHWRDWLLVHCNYVDDADIALIASKNASVAYCPIASEYFQHKNHRYRDMLQASINVALGSDSAICQPPNQRDSAGIWSALQRLYQRDKTNPRLLIQMATTSGARALGLESWYAWQNPVTFAEFDPDSSQDPLINALLKPS